MKFTVCEISFLGIKVDVYKLNLTISSSTPSENRFVAKYPVESVSKTKVKSSKGVLNNSPRDSVLLFSTLNKSYPPILLKPFDVKYKTFL